MNRILIVSFLLFGFESKPILPTIEINSVNIDISTVARVDCSKFHESFEDSQIRIRIVTEEQEINDLISELHNLKVYAERKSTDTRATIIIKYSDHVESICADRFSVCKDGTCYQMTDKLKKTIW